MKYLFLTKCQNICWLVKNQLFHLFLERWGNKPKRVNEVFMQIRLLQYCIVIGWSGDQSKCKWGLAKHQLWLAVWWGSIGNWNGDIGRGQHKFHLLNYSIAHEPGWATLVLLDTFFLEFDICTDWSRIYYEGSGRLHGSAVLMISLTSKVCLGYSYVMWEDETCEVLIRQLN